jgi:hypothetical protein
MITLLDRGVEGAEIDVHDEAVHGTDEVFAAFPERGRTQRRPVVSRASRYSPFHSLRFDWQG